MRIHAALAADLALLTEALDHPSVDLSTTLALLMSQSAVAVPSYVGLTVRLSVAHVSTELTTLDHVVPAERVATSLRFRLPGDAAPPTEVSAVDIVLFASQPGAFVDLAADLAWLTARPLVDFVLDADSHEPRPSAAATTSVTAQSAINQALGVLIGEGRTLETASAELEARAAATQGGRHDVAVAILAGLDPDGPAHPASS